MARFSMKLPANRVFRPVALGRNLVALLALTESDLLLVSAPTTCFRSVYGTRPRVHADEALIALGQRRRLLSRFGEKEAAAAGIQAAGYHLLERPPVC